MTAAAWNSPMIYLFLFTDHKYLIHENQARIQIPTFYYSTNESEVEIDFTVQTEKQVIPHRSQGRRKRQSQVTQDLHRQTSQPERPPTLYAELH